MTTVNPITSATNVMTSAAASTVSKDVEKQIKKIENTASTQQGPQMVDAPNPASASGIEEADEVVNEITNLLKKIKEELKESVGANIKRATRYEMPSDIKEKVRHDLKNAFDATKNIYKEIEEIVNNLL